MPAASMPYDEEERLLGLKALKLFGTLPNPRLDSVLSEVADRVAVPMDAELHDRLTGALTKAGFKAVLQRRIDAQQLRGMSLPSSTIIGVDLRNFKSVNDRFGPSTGDGVLQLIVARLKLCLRQDDLIARIGGVEFAIYLGDLKDTAVMMRLRARIEKILDAPFEVEGNPFKVDASIGLSVVEPVHGDASALLNAVEAALFAAKHYRA